MFTKELNLHVSNGTGLFYNSLTNFPLDQKTLSL